MPACVFCSIVSGEAAAAVVYRDERALAFLDHRPVFPGHTLLVPLAHHETLPDLPPEEVGPFFRLAQVLAAAVPAALDAHGTFVAVNNIVSQSVPHLHLHVVPRRRKDGLRGFFWPRGRYDDAEHLERVRAAIADEVARRTG